MLSNTIGIHLAKSRIGETAGKGIHFLQQISSKGMEGEEGAVINIFKGLRINDLKIKNFFSF